MAVIESLKQARQMRSRSKDDEGMKYLMRAPKKVELSWPQPFW